MNYIRNVGDDQNKYGDTSSVFQISLIKDDNFFNFGDNQVTVNIANKSGYILSMTPERIIDNSYLKLDFSKEPLKQLTPDYYQLEVEVLLGDGDVAKFPTNGGMPFNINKSLKDTQGELVPTVTFDTVLEAVDKKVNNYLATVVKGDKGDPGEKGDTGVVDTTADYTWTGTNTFNKKIIAPAGVQGNADSATKLQTQRKINGIGFDGTSDITVDPVVKYINTNTDLFTLSNGFYYFNGIVATNKPVAASNWFTVEVIQNDTNGFMSLVDDNGLSFWTIKKLGYWWSSWHKYADDSTVVHNTGNETIAGDKTFTGLSTFAQPINGSLKTRDVPFTDFNDVAKNMVKYAGTWFVKTQSIIGSPIANYYTVTVTPAVADVGSGYIELVPIGVGSVSKYIAVVSFQTLSAWKTFAFNDGVVHNSGTETVNGDKTFTGNNSFKGVQVLAQSATVEFPMWYGSKMKATRFGNMVSLAYSTAPNQDIPSGVTSIETIPFGFRPTFDWYMNQGGVSTSGGSAVMITKNGNLSVYGPVSVAYPYTMNATYFTNDTFQNN